MYTWDWDWVWTYRHQLIDAAVVTLILNVFIIFFGSILGLVLGLAKRSKMQIVKFISVGFIDVFRTLPVLVLLIWFYFSIPILLDIRLTATISAIIVLSINLSAFVAEIIDAGIQSVPKVHTESAKALGMNSGQKLRFIILPIALRNMTPPLVGQYINTVKLSVLASIIAVPELLNITQDLISQTYRPLEFYTVLALIFLVILLPGTIWSKRMESRSVLSRMKNVDENPKIG